MRSALCLVVLVASIGCSAAGRKPEQPPLRVEPPPLYNNGRELVPDCSGWAGSNSKRYQACLRIWLENMAELEAQPDSAARSTRQDTLAPSYRLAFASLLIS